MTPVPAVAKLQRGLFLFVRHERILTYLKILSLVEKNTSFPYFITVKKSAGGEAVSVDQIAVRERFPSVTDGGGITDFGRRHKNIGTIHPGLGRMENAEFVSHLEGATWCAVRGGKSLSIVELQNHVLFILPDLPYRRALAGRWMGCEIGLLIDIGQSQTGQAFAHGLLAVWVYVERVS